MAWSILAGLTQYLESPHSSVFLSIYDVAYVLQNCLMEFACLLIIIAYMYLLTTGVHDNNYTDYYQDYNVTMYM